MPLPDPEPSIRVGRGRGWTVFGAISVAVVVAIVAILWWQDHAAKTARRDRIRAARHAVADALTAYARCAGGDHMVETWAARPDYGSLVNTCDEDYAEAVQGAAARVHYDDSHAIEELGWMPSRYYERSAALPGAVCQHLLELAVGLGADAPDVDCDASVPPFTDDTLTDAGLRVLLGEVDGPWTEIVGGRFTAGGHFEDGGVVHTVAVAERDGPWRSADLTGKLWSVMRWATPDTAWAFQDGRVVEQAGDGTWKPLARLPGVRDVRAMRVVDGGRVLVVEQRGGFAVVRLDAAAATETGRVALGVDRAEAIWITRRGDVVVKNEGDPADVIVTLPAGATAAARTTMTTDAGFDDECDDGTDLFLVFGSQLLHSTDGGATLSLIRSLPGPRTLEIACGPGWLAAVDRSAAAAGAPSYFVCRGATCSAPVAITARHLDEVEVVRQGDGVRVYGEQPFEAGLLYEDRAAAGALAFVRAWDVSDPVPFRKIDGVWFQTRYWP